MTTELKKTFFDTFGIEPKLNDCNWQCQKPNRLIYMCANNNDCEYCKEYTQISDRQYLELICIDFAENPYKGRGYVGNVEELKNYILKQFIHEFENDLYWEKESVKHQVQNIFKESEQE